ncbi:hypothetical protein [Chitinibacter tainanensis]|uniref:recombination directionality factor n=1 Tax=Chitinibacter tainanensis TaxID=230667 RepID=UPI0023563A32|nr:hypothetical protein [Chitinibacter tainanensis]
MIKGLAITPPVIGRISIGHLVEKNGKYLPEKDDCFTLTTQVQGKEGWLLHPLHQVLVENSPNNKIRAIAIKLLFNDSDLNLRAEFSAFDRQTGRPLCVGDGETAKRVTNLRSTGGASTGNAGEGTEELSCPGPERCLFGKEKGCKLYGRLNVQVDGQQDELGSFMFRTTGYNSVRTLAARLAYFHAVSNGLSRFLPLQLKLRAKSTTQSYRAPVYYVDLTLRDDDSLVNAVAKAHAEAQQFAEAGINIAQLEHTARQLLANGQFEDSSEELPQVLAEFYPEPEIEGASASAQTQPAVVTPKPANPKATPPVVRSSPITDRLGPSTAGENSHEPILNH